MPSFAVRAVNGVGRIQSDVLEAPSASELKARLTDEGLLPLSVSEHHGPGGPGWSLRIHGNRSRGPAVARQLAVLLEAEVPLAEALRLASEASSGDTERETLRQVLARIERGDRLVEALAEPPMLFPPIALGMIAAGERSGSLARAFTRLADHLEKRDEQRRKLVSALSYPAFVFLAGLAASAVLVVAVLPRFSEMLEAAGVALPATTAVLLGAGSAVGRFWLPALLVIGVAIGGAVIALRDLRLRRVLHERLLRLPGIGRVRRAQAAIHAGEVLSSQLSQGVPLLAALETAADASSDLAVAAGLRGARERVRAGASLSHALSETSVFPPNFVRMVRIGEGGGAVASLMHRAAIVEEHELDRWIGVLIRYAEPALIIGFGGFIGFVALALLQAVYGIQGGIVP